MIEKNYAGLDGFVWWIGVVESRLDPMLLGRCKVRVYGFHSGSLSDIPTEDLPWAHPVYPVNGGDTFSTPKEGQMVFGFFADGRNAQVPIIVGSMPTVNRDRPDVGFGFNDVRPNSLIAVSPKKVVGRRYNYDGTGVTLAEANTANTEVLESLRYPQEELINVPSITGLSRNELNYNDVTASRKSRSNQFVRSANNQYFKEPEPSYGTAYPFNKAFESESGHSLEFDDTPNNERITLSHRSGTFQEVYPSGTKVEEVVKNNYKVVFADDHIHIIGRAYIKVDSDAYIKVKGDTFVEAGNDLDAKVSGNMNLSVRENLNIKAKNLNIDIQEEATLVSRGNQYLTSNETIHVSAKNVRETASEKIDLLGVDEVTIQGTLVNVNSTAADEAESGVPEYLPVPEPRETKNDAPRYEESGPSPFEVVAFEDDFEKDLPTLNSILVDNGIQAIVPEEPVESESSVPQPGGEPKMVSCGDVKIEDDYSKVRLSKNFTLAQLTQGGSRKLVDQKGLTADQILCNLVNLAENVLEPILEAGYKFNITSGFRRPGDVAASAKNSDHYLGTAVDIQVQGMSQFKAANEIFQKVGGISSKFLLEYTSGGGAGWIHISYDKKAAGSKFVATFLDHKTYVRDKFVNLRA